MKDASTKEATTNTTPKSSVDVNCDCNTMWSLAQQFSTLRLCMSTGEHTGKLIKDYTVRARRIAATYARFYLEHEEGGDQEKVGRYYWMALGAFARKTVACTFETWQVEAMSIGLDTVWEGLEKVIFGSSATLADGIGTTTCIQARSKNACSNVIPITMWYL